MTQSAYKRIMLKISGEALMGDDPFGINQHTISNIVHEIKEALDLKIQMGIVIGGGNIFRGVALGAAGMDRATADYMGMMATVMNALALQDAMKHAGIVARVQSALNIEQVVEPYIRGKAMRYLEEGKVVIFAAGTGNPFFTTDTAAALRGVEMNADIMIKATKVDGIYSEDPKKNPKAKRYEVVSFDEAIQKDLKVMDATALTLCRDQQLPIAVFNIFKSGALKNILLGQSEGTLVMPNIHRLKRIVMTEAIKVNVSEKMQKSLDSFKSDLAKVRTGRAHTGLLDHIVIDYYGSMVPINQVAAVNLGDAKTINVQPYEKSMVGKIEKAIRDSELGLNPATSGDLIRVPMPTLTEERRKDLIKVVRTEAESAKVAVRNIRRDANDSLKKLIKEKEISEDDERKAQDEVQKTTDKFIAEIDKLLQLKESELLAI